MTPGRGDQLTLSSFWALVNELPLFLYGQRPKQMLEAPISVSILIIIRSLSPTLALPERVLSCLAAAMLGTILDQFGAVLGQCWDQFGINLGSGHWNIFAYLGC